MYMYQSQSNLHLSARWGLLQPCTSTAQVHVNISTHVLHISMTARNEYSGPSLHICVGTKPPLSDLVPTIFCLLPLNVFSMLPSVSPPQCKVGALFKPLLPLTHMQEKDLPMMLNSVEPPSMLQPQPKSHAKSQPQTRPSSNSLTNGGTL